MNVFKINDIRYKYESYWRKNKDSKETDTNNNILPYPVHVKSWNDKIFFANKLNVIEKFLDKNDKFIKYDTNKHCLLCNHKNITTGLYTLNRIRWENGLSHYIKVHNIRPTEEFQRMVYNFKQQHGPKPMSEISRIKGKIKKHDDVVYLQITRNQLLIIDALMIHGSHSKKYSDTKNEDFKFSEHSGLIDFNNKGLDKIIVSGKTTRVDKEDDEIFFPKNIAETYDYEYIFHTHPATPKIGGRAEVGVLYEMPSISDLFHFIEHYNNGITQGSIIMAPEGLYNIRADDTTQNKIKINEDSFYDKIRKSFLSIQNDAINEYGTDFSLNTFYTKITHNTEYIDRFNKVLNKFNIQVDYYPRIKDKQGKWVVDSIYFPVRPIEIYK